MDPQQERNWNERSDRVLTVKNETKRVSRGATASGPKTLSRRVGDTAQAVCHQHTRTREIRRRFSNPRTAEMSRRLPPSNRLMWGFNISAWKNGFHWLDADEACDAGSIARSVCADPAQILEVPFAEAASNEQPTQN